MATNVNGWLVASLGAGGVGADVLTVRNIPPNQTKTGTLWITGGAGNTIALESSPPGLNTFAAMTTVAANGCTNVVIPVNMDIRFNVTTFAAAFNAVFNVKP